MASPASSPTSLDYLDEFDPSRGVPFRTHLLAGSFAGLAEHCLMFPLDTIKTLSQCVGACGKPQSPDVLCVRATKTLLREGYENGLGALRLWRGVGAVTVACVPAHAAYFGLFEATRAYGAPHRLPRDDVVVNGLAGSLAAIGHDLIMTPADVVKQRLQLGHHRGVLDAVRDLVAAKPPTSAGGPGGLAALYRSLPTTLAMNAPYGSVSVAANEWLKARAVRRQHTQRASASSSSPADAGDLGVGTLLACGGLAGALASLATTPLDVVKTRLQTQGLELFREKPRAGPPPPTGAPHDDTTGRRRRHVAPSFASSSSSSSSAGASSAAAEGDKRFARSSQWATRHWAARENVTHAAKHEAPRWHARHAVLHGASRDHHHHHHHRLLVKHRPPSGQPHSTSTSTSTPPPRTTPALKYRGFLDAALAVWREDGARGFFRGATVRALAQAPSVAIVWTTYELFVKFLATP